MFFLTKSKATNTILNELSSEITIRKIEYDNIKLDYFVITLYGEFEKEIDRIIEEKIHSKTNFCKNYISYLKRQDSKLHRGFKGNKFNDLVKNVFGVEILNIINNNDWVVFKAFIEFRHVIAHANTAEYNQKKDALIRKIKGTNDLIISVENILLRLNKISRVKLNKN